MPLLSIPHRFSESLFLCAGLLPAVLADQAVGQVPGDSGIGLGPAPPLAVASFSATAARRHQQAWAKHLGRPVELANSIGRKLTLIPPGEFVMGSTVRHAGKCV